MKKSNSMLKAQSAFKKLGAVSLITATLAVCFTACKQTGGGGESTPKHAINFSVDSTTPNGTLKAKADGVPETSTSPINIEEGKTVTFTATANSGYRVKGWTLDGKAVNGTNTEYKLTVTKVVTVKVSFEAIPPTKYTVTLTQTEGGTVTALPEIPADKLMVKDTEITFTATANEGYKIGKWKVTPAEALQAGTGADGSETSKVKITADTTVSVSFEAIPKHEVTFSVDGANGTLKAKSDGVDETETSPINVEEGKEVTFTAKANSGYRVKGWTLDGSPITEAGTNTEYKFTVTKATTVKVSFELSHVEGGAMLILNPDKLTIRVRAATADGSDIAVEGCEETTLTSNYHIDLHAKGTTVILRGKITELDCIGENDSKGPITSLNVQGCASLEELFCSFNQLTSLNVQGLTALRKLSCKGSEDNKGLLTTLNAQGCTALKEIECYYNQLTAVNVQGCTSLEKLDCYNNQLTSLDVQGLTSLEKLYCYNNQLAAINVQGCTSLQKFYCTNNQLTSLDVSGLTALQSLLCNNNQLNAKAMTKLLTALPRRKRSDGAWALLYSEKTDVLDGNCKDYSKPEDLKTAFDEAKDRNWRLKKENARGNSEDI